MLQQSTEIETNCCIFVGGLNATFTEEVLQAYFGQYGTLESIELKRRKKKKINRGFCILKFSNKSSVEKILEKKDHKIEGRLVTCRPYLSGERLHKSQIQKKNKKIYISELPKETTNSDIVDVFSKFGRVEAGYTLRDKENQHSKGFGFVVFEEEEAITRVLEQEEIKVLGVKVNIERFEVAKIIHVQHSDSSLRKNDLQQKMKKKEVLSTFDRKSQNFVKGDKFTKNFKKKRKSQIVYTQQLQQELNHHSDQDDGHQNNEQEHDSHQKNLNPQIIHNLKSPNIGLPNHVSFQVSNSPEFHQMLPYQSQYHQNLRNHAPKSWHDIDISNIKLRIGNLNE